MSMPKNQMRIACENGLEAIGQPPGRANWVYNDKRNGGRRYKFAGIHLTPTQNKSLAAKLADANPNYEFVVTQTATKEMQETYHGRQKLFNAGTSILVREKAAA